MFTIGPSLYATLVSIKGLKANFTLILALSHTGLGFIEKLLLVLIFSSDNPSDLHDEIIFPVFSKYLYAP